jgi:hypothetical protein
LFALEYVYQERRNARGDECRDTDKQQEPRPIQWPFGWIALRAHEWNTVLSFT